MNVRLRSLLAATAFIVTVPSAMAEDATPYVELDVGRTRIQCYTEPCPWNGIANADSPVSPVTLLWAGAEPPPMRGKTEDRIFILENYAENCTRLSGRYEGGILEIAKILGPC
jgi:hypothetical protein